MSIKMSEHDVCISLFNLFDKHEEQEPSSINQYMISKHSKSKLFEDISIVEHIVHQFLETVATTICHATSDQLDFLHYDVKAICLLMFKPYFTNTSWITSLAHQLHESSWYKRSSYELDNHETYASLLEYMKEFIADLSA